MNAAPLALNACAASVFRLVEAHGCDAPMELIEPVSEQRFIFFERTQRNSRLQDWARRNLKNVDLRLRTPRLRDHGDTSFMPILGAQMLLKGLQTS